MGEETLTFFATFVAVGIISVSLYFLMLRPMLPTDDATGRIGPATDIRPNPRGNRYGNNNHAVGGAANGAISGEHYNSKDNSSIENVLAECATIPVHCVPSSQSACRAGGSNLLVDGLLAFRHCRASGLESSSGGDMAARNRKERARILSRLRELEGAATSSTSPPVRGSTFVIAIPAAEVSCTKLRRVLYLFATYYNLLVIVVMQGGNTTHDLESCVSRLRGDSNELGEEVLPDHRIVASSTATGRVAFVRQLTRAEIVLDFDTEVRDQLTRFGYRVVICEKTGMDNNNASQLGSQLLS